MKCKCGFEKTEQNAASHNYCVFIPDETTELIDQLRTELSEAQERIKELEERVEFDEKFTCHDCQDTGWLEDRTGRYPCTCFTECEGSPYDVEVQKVKVLREALDSAYKMARLGALPHSNSENCCAEIIALIDEALKETE